MLIDYHLHNHFSPDSETDTRKLIERMQEKGVKHICLTNHGEWFDKVEETVGVFEFDEVFKRLTEAKKEIEKLRPEYPDMDIAFGLELQCQPEVKSEIKKLLSEIQFDYILGSVHIMGGVVISGGHHSSEYFNGKTEEQAYTAYFKKLFQWVEDGDFDNVAHFDIIKKTGYRFYGNFHPKLYKPIIMEILKKMKETGKGIELNTGCMHYKCNELFPHPEILKWCVEIGIENYTLGSDAHELHEVGRYLDEALRIAKDVGIEHLSTYKNRIPTKHII